MTNYLATLCNYIILLLVFLFGMNNNVYAADNHKTIFQINQYLYSQARPRVALVLGGGGARGGAHLGVLSVLEQAGVPIDLVVGTSIGSVVGVLYADNPHAQVVNKILLNTKESDLLHFSLLSAYSGPLSHLPIENFVHSKVTAQNFDDLKIKFVAVSSDVVSGQTVALSTGPIAPAIAASISLPPYFSPVKIDDHLLVDGGVTDPVAVNIAKYYNPQVIIAVSIAETLPPFRPTTSALTIYDRAALIKKQQYDQLCAAGADVFIHPDVGQIGLFDGSHEYALMQVGKLAAMQALPQICAVLAKNNIPSNCQAMLKQ